MKIPDTEAEIYDYLTKDGTNKEAIRQNTRMLRDVFLQEKERRIHALSTYDPSSKDRHTSEAERIQEERNRRLDEVLMEVANSSSTTLPVHREAFISASKNVGVPRTHITAWLALPVLLMILLPLAAYFGPR